MIVYRVCQAAYAATAAEMIAGTGGLHSAGRWHTVGKRIVYVSQNLSLAAHEISVHYPRRKHALSFSMCRVDISDDLILTLEALGVKTLPSGWDSQPPGSGTQSIGDRWLAAQASAALQVPSVIIPGEFNYLLNPEHADFRLVRAASPQPFSFDPRL